MAMAHEYIESSLDDCSADLSSKKANILGLKMALTNYHYMKISKISLNWLKKMKL